MISVVFIFSVKNNIKHDFYNQKLGKIFWFKDSKSDETYGIVVTKYTIIEGFIIAIYLIMFVILYFGLFPDIFTINEKERLSKFWQLCIIDCLFLLGYIAHFGWKLVIKQFFIHKYHIHVKIRQPSEE